MNDRLRRAVHTVETALLVALLLVMIGVAVYQVLARNLFGTGIVWGDELVRVSVLWVTMIGAASAAATDSHIRIDIVSRFASERMNGVASRITSAFTALVCGLLGWYSVRFIHWDYLDDTIGFGAVPAWVCELIIPVAAGVMALRYLVRAVTGGEARTDAEDGA
ncbi:MAG: TRAP transporter small permease [Gammaproteobacteria bacterium]|nr:TRAP transporter small permease [Gammaproteobacteria bacterium]